jgi:transcriptional antiterminator NusG
MSDRQKDGQKDGSREKKRARWYVVHVYSGFEKRIKDLILEEAKDRGLEETIEAIEIPSQDFVEIKRGKKVSTERRIFPGYILIKMHLYHPTWNLIKGLPKVTGFLDDGKDPIPMRDAEAEKLLTSLDENSHVSLQHMEYRVGEEIRVGDGPFVDFKGVVEEVDLDRARLKVLVSIFGRQTPVELEFNQVEKL